MKKILLVGLLLALLCSAVSVSAAQEVTVLLNGEKLEFDVPPQIIDDRTLVPLRAIFEAFGASVEWIEADQMILASYDSKLLSMVIGQQEFVLTDAATGEKAVIQLDVPAQIVNDRTLVPLRAIAESLSAEVNWNEADQTVSITSQS